MINEDNFIFEQSIDNEINGVIWHSLCCGKFNAKVGDYNYAMDLSGNVYFKTKFDLCGQTGEYITFKKDGLWGLLDNNGKVIIPPISRKWLSGYKYDSYYTDDYKWGIIDNKGNVKVPAVFDHNCGYSYFDENYCIGAIDEKYGVVNIHNKVIIPFEYEFIETYIDKGKYKDCLIVKKNGKEGIINIKNEIIIPFEYDYIKESFKISNNKGYFIANKNGKEGIINEKNEIMLPFEYERIDELSAETYFASKNENEHFILDYNFNKIRDVNFDWLPSYDNCDENSVNDFIAYFDCSWGLIDKYGNIIIDFKYTDLEVIYEKNEEIYLLAQKEHGSYGIIDINENIIVPFEYEGWNCIKTSIKNDYTVTMIKNGKYGVFNIKTNEVLVDFIYDYIYPFLDNKTTVAKYKGEWGVINKKGESIKYYLTKAKELRI